jgi:hypothetical protein
MGEQGLVKVNFYGQQIDCVKDAQGVWVSLRRICENIGLAFDAQRVKLQGKSWACVTTIVSHDTSGRDQEMTMLHLDSVPMWLATIDVERVAEHIRPTLERYQKECSRALRDFWFTGEAVRDVRPSPALRKFSPAEIYRFAIAAAKDLVKLGTKPDVAQMAALATVRDNTGVDIEPMRNAIAGRTQQEDALIPTQLGELLGISARSVNTLLAEGGLQRRLNGEWHMTETGGKYGELVPVDAANGHKGMQIKWRPGVVDVLRAQLAVEGTGPERPS